MRGINSFLLAIMHICLRAAFIISISCSAALSNTESDAEITSQHQVFAHPIENSNTLDNLLQIHAVDGKIVRASFTQQKKLKVLKRPLNSNGRLTLSETSGLLWQVLKPLPSDYVFQSDAAYQWRQGQLSAIPFSQSPIFKGFADTFIAALSGDISKLSNNFSIYLTPQSTPEHWCIGLKPANEAMAKGVDYMVLEGGVYLSRLVLSDTSGDVTTLNFENYELGDALSEAEKALYPPAP
ncbi:MAG: hypothetical protein CMF25_06625 [Kangiellaceae bacterium]|nr:hypothetical protein [Kangiellaceae bacterium]|tara:strand:- start:243 stop:959 length:717 start_codon:yes stop_codon:yes gene_type:complete